MGLPELKSIRRFGLGRRSLKEQPERRSWRAAESSATTGRLPNEVRDPAALRAYTTPNICVQGGRIEFIQPPPVRRERADGPGERQEAATTPAAPPSCSGLRQVSPLRDAGRRQVSPLRDAGHRQEAPAMDGGRRNAVTARERLHRDFASLRDGDIRAVSSLKDRDARTVSSSKDRGVRTLASLKDRDLHHTVPNIKDRSRHEVASPREKDVCEMSPLIEDDQEEVERETGVKVKEQKEENNQEMRNTRPAPSTDQGSPVRSPTPGRKVKDKVAKFEQLVVPQEGPRRDSESSESTTAQGTLEAEIQSLELGLEEECMNFKRWNRLAQRTAGETRSRQSRQLLNMSVGSDTCRDRVFSIQDELRRSEERLRAAELARAEAEEKIAAMDALIKAHEKERQHWLGQVHQLSGQLERLQAASPSPAEAESPSRSDLEVRVRSLEVERVELESRSDHCLDDVANQIVQALSQQKMLQSSLDTIRRRVHQLEQENAVLFSLLGRAPNVTSQPPLPAPAAAAASADDDQLTAACAKVRRLLEEHYGSSAGRGAAPPPGPLRWSQFDGLLSEDAAAVPCLLCASHACDSSCRLYQPCGNERTVVRRAAAAADDCSTTGGHQAAGSDVMRRLCEVADSASAAQRILRQLGSDQCVMQGAASVLDRVPSPLLLSTALTDSQKCATLGVLPLGLPPPPSDLSPPPSGASLSALSSERLPPSSGARASSCPPHGAGAASREDPRREEGRDEGYSTMSSDVQANVSADSGVSTGSVEAPNDSRPRLEDVREVQEEDGRPIASVSASVVSVVPERPERPASVSSSDSEDMRCLVEALRQSLRPGRRLHLLAEGAAESDVLYLPLTGPAVRHSCLVPARPRPVHRCRSDSRLCVKRWAAAEAAAKPWPGRAPERSSSTLELGAASTLDTRRAASLKRAAGQASLERGGSPPETPTFVPAALPWRDDSSELWRNCFSLEAREMEDWSLHLSAEELRSEPTDDAAGSERLADSSDYSRVGSFPNIQEAILELEEDASECLWNNASYMHQRPTDLPAWPYEHPADADPPALPSPGADLRISWSSCEQISLADLRDAVLDFNDKNDLKSVECESRLEAQAREDLKRHSNGSDAMSCASVASEDERPENLETEFTRDFYRLVKYESSKSLALSEASAKGDDEPLVSSADREMALASMLNFITEQQRYIAERETEDAAQALEPVTDSDSTSCATMDQSTSSAASAATTITAPATAERAFDEREALDSTIQLAMLAQRCERSSPAPEPQPCSSSSLSSPSPLTTSTISPPTTPLRDAVSTAPSVATTAASPVGSSVPEVIVYRAEISTNHKEYTPPAEPVQKRVGSGGRCRNGATVRSSPKTATPPASTSAPASTPSIAPALSSATSSTPSPVSASTPSPASPSASPSTSSSASTSANASKTTKEAKSGIPRSPLIGKRKRPAANNIPRMRPPTSPKLTPRLKKDAVRPLPEPVEPPPAPAAPATPAPKSSFPSPKLLRRLHPGSSKIANRSSSESAISRGARRVEPAPAPRPDSPQRRATAPPAPARAATRPGSRIPRLRGSRSTDSREAAGAAVREARELQRTVSEPAEMPASRRSPLIVSQGDVTSFHRRATSRQLIDELKRLSALEAQDAPPPPSPKPRALREGCDTGWVRVDRHLDLDNSQVRSELYDVMLATRGSSDSSSSDSESDVTPRSASEYQHLKLVHQQRRRKQVSRRKDGALRFTPVFRPPIINRPEFFFRYGPQERAALATFDFLDRLPSASAGDVTAGRR